MSSCFYCPATRSSCFFGPARGRATFVFARLRSRATPTAQQGGPFHSTIQEKETDLNSNETENAVYDVQLGSIQDGD